MKTYDKLVEERHKLYVEDMRTALNSKIAMAMHEKDEIESTLKHLTLAVQSAGHPDMCQYTSAEMVSVMFNNIRQLDELNKKISALDEVRELLRQAEGTTFLEG